MLVMGRLLPLLMLADIALMVVALIDCLSADEFTVRALPKIVWVFIILLFSPVGPIVYLVAGRPQSTPARGRSAWSPGSGFPESGRPARPYGGGAPDDNPEFLADLARQRRDDEALFERWEADLRRREEKLRDREDPPSDPKRPEQKPPEEE
jgi:hypothetical protein